VTREEAISQLASPSTHARLKASRFLSRNAQPVDLAVLRAARTTETSVYVRGSLDRAIERLTSVATLPQDESLDESEISESSRRQIYAQATEWIAGLLLHEIASPIGLLAFEASREVPSYAESRTKAHIGTLQMVFDAIAQLRKASATPKPKEFDLAGLVDEVVATEFAAVADSIATQGPRPTVLVSDAALLRFAICNGLRNAVEAVSGVTVDAPSVVVTWGETDVDYWVCILDSGQGIVGSVESLLGIGKTTKPGHSGFGLPIAIAAVEALDGTLTLETAARGGAKYEMRWEK
jgi:signal transduction histidine kinase